MTNYKTFDIPYKYKGFKIFRTHDIKTFKIYSNTKVLEFSPAFLGNLNGYQKYFLLMYCVKFYKMKDIAKASDAAIDAYKLIGLPENDIFQLLDQINENKKIQKFIQFNILSWLSANKLKLTIYKLLNTFNHVRNT